MNTIPLPSHVASSIETLTRNAAVTEIWLIGSRVNGTASANSDWDILDKSTSKPLVREKDHADIDVIWCGPSGWCLAGGVSEHARFPFSDFEWSESRGMVSYVGRKFADIEYGVVRDASQPVQVRTRQSGLRVWPVEKPSEQRV